MTLDEVMKLTPEQVQRRVAELTGNNLPYHTDLNAAMSLVPQDEAQKTTPDSWNYYIALDSVVSTTDDENSPWSVWAHACPDKPPALCRAYILWKDGGK